MAKRWLIADTHFGHTNIIKYESRPFPDAEQMDYQIIGRWNRVVSKDDTVFVLGDFGFYNQEKLKSICSQLNGNKYLVMGNHDHHKSVSWWKEVGFDNVSKYPIIVDEYFIMSHQPVYLNNHMPYFNLHGHLHSSSMEGNNYFSVSCEQINYTPIDFEEIKNKYIKEE